MAYSGAWHSAEGTADDSEMLKNANEAASPKGKRPPRRPVLDLGELFHRTEVAGMETDDLLMALVLYLMYRESGDMDLLIMLGVMLLT